jgi:ADP-ribose pyrophosphatase YjhB (NUDIX family)
MTKNKYYVSNRIMKDFRTYFTMLAVEFVIDFGGKVLLVRRKEDPKKGQWHIPGGRVYKTEDARKAAVRVAKQETGLPCKIIKEMPPSREIIPGKGWPRDGIYDAYCLVYLMKPASRKAKIRIDSTSREWMFADHIQSSFNPYLKRILKNSKVFKKA